MGSHSVTCRPTQVNAPRLSASHAGWYSIYLPPRDGRLSWPSWLDKNLAGSRTSDLSITSPTPNHCTTKMVVQRQGVPGTGPATEKTLQPTVESLTCGTSRLLELAERSVCRPGWSATQVRGHQYQGTKSNPSMISLMYPHSSSSSRGRMLLNDVVNVIKLKCYYKAWYCGKALMITRISMWKEVA